MVKVNNLVFSVSMSRWIDELQINLTSKKISQGILKIDYKVPFDGITVTENPCNFEAQRAMVSDWLPAMWATAKIFHSSVSIPRDNRSISVHSQACTINACIALTRNRRAI